MTSGDMTDVRAVPSHAVADANADEPRRDDVEGRPGGEWWPLDRTSALELPLAYVALTAAFALIGWAVVRWWESSTLGVMDADVSRWFNDHRTTARTDLAHWGSMLSGTQTMIAASVLMLPLVWWLLGRLHEWVLIAGGLVLEVSVFISAASLVGRDRPPVEQLEAAPTASWPSGHIAAAVVFYGGLAVLVAWHCRNERFRRIATAACMIPPVIVITSRLYLGMHYVTDAIGGTALGVLCLVVMSRQVLRSEAGLQRPTHQ